jgi:hypothetical protein
MAIVFQLERNGALFGVHGVVRSKVLDTADIVREAIFRQPFKAQAKDPCSSLSILTVLASLFTT